MTTILAVETVSAPVELPQSLEAEVAVLGGVLVAAGGAYASEVLVVASSLDGSEFFRDAHQRIHRAMLQLYGRGQAVDFITLSEELKQTGELERVGGMEYLRDLLEAVPTAANIEYHARIVRGNAQLRELIQLCQRMQADALGDGEETAEDVIARFDDEIRALTLRSAPTTEVVSLAEVLADPDAGKPPECVAPRIAWGGRVTLLAAREKAGKSTLASAIAAAVSSGYKLFGAPT